MKRLILLTAFLGLAGTTLAEAQTVKPEKMLVVYYSMSGNTKAVAEHIRKATGAATFEIKTQKAYPEDYRELLAISKKEIENKDYPALQGMPGNLDKYDVIFVGTPNWYSTMAPAVNTFFENGKIADKIVIPFVTHGGGGMAKCEKDMQAACPKAKFLKGIAIDGSNAPEAEKSVRKWLKEIGMME